MNRLAKWLPRLILAAAFVTILPIGNLVTKIIYEGAPHKRIATPRDLVEVEKFCKEIAEEAEKKGRDYNATLYYADLCKIIRRTTVEFDLQRSDYESYIEKIYSIAQRSYVERISGTGVHPDYRLANWDFDQDFNAGLVKFGIPEDEKYYTSSNFDQKLETVVKVLVRCYCQFIPFAFLLILLQIQSRQGTLRLWHELREFHYFLLSCVFWPYGLIKYGSGSYPGANHYRYWRLRARYEELMNRKKFFYTPYRLSPEEDARLWAEARKDGDYLDQVARLAHVSRDLVASQSLTRAFVGMAFSLCLTMFFTAGRCLAVTKESASLSVVAGTKNGEEFKVTEKSSAPQTLVIESPPPIPHWPLLAVLPIGPITFGPVCNPCVAVYRIRPPPEPVFPIDHVPWLCD